MEQIYLEYHDKVMGYIRARVHGWADAEDLCADVLEMVQRELPDYDPEKASVSTWVFTITRNTVIDFFRRAKHPEELDENMSDDSAVEENLLQTETLGELATALRKLPQQLMDIIPRELWGQAHHWLIFHGRQVCHARKPECQRCTLSSLCPSASLPEVPPDNG